MHFDMGQRAVGKERLTLRGGGGWWWWIKCGAEPGRTAQDGMRST